MDVDELQALKRERKEWREADLHGLRILYAEMLVEIAQHRWDVQNGGDQAAANWRLWNFLHKELG